MQYTLIGTGVLAVATIGTITMMPSTPGSPTPTIFDAAVVDVAPPPALTDARVTFDEQGTLTDAIAAIHEQVEMPIVVDWDLVEMDGIDVEEPFAIVANDAPVTNALEMIVQRIGDIAMVPYAFRFGEHAIEITHREKFDRREMTLICYDVSPVLRTLLDDYNVPYDDASDRVAELIMGLVDADSWEHMGGDIAQLEIVGGKMFVNAPPRMQHRVKWIVDQLLQEDAAADGLARDGGRGSGVGTGTGTGLDAGHGSGGGLGRGGDHPAVVGGGVGVEPLLVPGQVITIEVFELYNGGEWFQTRRQLDEGGMIRLAGLEPVRAVGRTATQVERDLVKAASVIMQNPLVNLYTGDMTR